MNKGLAVKYRPTEFSDMAGQKVIRKILDSSVGTPDFPKALLFAGSSGTGKTTAARIVASRVADTEYSTIEVDAASHNGVAHIRDLVDKVKFSMGTGNRVVILDEAHSLTPDSFNALLTVLEDPPEGVVFILITTEAHKIPRTVESRLVTLEFRPVQPEEIYERLQAISSQEEIVIDDEALAVIAMNSDGNLRRALQFLELASMSGTHSREDALRLLGVQDSGADIVESMWNGTTSDTFSLVDEALSVTGSTSKVLADIANVFKNIFILRSGGKVSSTTLSAQKVQKLASEISTDRAMAVCRVLWEAQGRIPSSSDPRTDLELAVALVSNVLTQGRSSADIMDAGVSTSEEEIIEDREVDLEELDI